MSRPLDTLHFPFSPVCAPYACLLPPSHLSLFPLSPLGPLWLPLGPAPPGPHSGGVTGPSTRQPAASSLSPAPRLGSPLRAPAHFDHLVTSPLLSARPTATRPGGRPIVTSPLRTGPRGPGPDRTRPDTTSRSRTPLHRAGPPASATGHHPYQTYRPSQGRTQKPIVVVLDSTRRWNSRTSPTSSPALRARTRSTTSSTSHATSQFVSQPPGANRLLATAPAVCT